ncbi:dTDP-4-dehydrorhamnose reductase [Nocardia sp. alder85J]|uniref:dTDP-4-dehydrorhamnose reductase n=1 Tax=Nocardia sp. alder85J TaxID=2862949 RepID=UPI001CD76E3C|nr:dTDP-4-dehydrorhamnose reductase [Nocardia sp. alder85J]MCX4096841.1 dTDP-4-dehydrorhamnose reductase [Nocardia sp. alder85J]
MSRLLVTGAGGLLGTRITSPASPFRDGRRTLLGLTSTALDITDATALDQAIRPGDVVINCAAYSAVDAAESDTDRAFAINATGAALLARVCARRHARLLHLSTGYVFDGKAAAPYEVDAPTAPINAYGRSKLAGEQAVRAELPEALIVRTMWLYSGAITGFPAALLRKYRQDNPIAVVADQFASPTYTGDLVTALHALLAHPDPPLLTHATSGGTASKFEFARAVAETAGLDPDRLSPCRTTDFPAAADRPRNAVLSDASWTGNGLRPLPHWRDALHRAMTRSARAGIR